MSFKIKPKPARRAISPTIELSAALVAVFAELEKLDHDRWGPGDLGHAAVCLAHWGAHTERAMLTQHAQIDAATYQLQPPPGLYPARAPVPWKPQNPRRDLVRAAAYLIAQIEQIDERIGIGAAAETATPVPDAAALQ